MKDGTERGRAVRRKSRMLKENTLVVCLNRSVTRTVFLRELLLELTYFWQTAAESSSAESYCHSEVSRFHHAYFLCVSSMMATLSG